MKVLFILMSIFIMLSLSLCAHALQKTDEQEKPISDSKRYRVSLKDWPKDIASKIISVAPEIISESQSLEDLNSILKKLDNKFNFNKLNATASGAMRAAGG